jgi:hypothetical protein
MAILKRTCAILAAGAAMAAMFGLSAAPALAATSWTVTPAGPITGKSGLITFKDTKTSNSVTCGSSSASATLKKGSGLSGTGLGSASKLSFTSCTGPLDTPFTVTPHDLPWKLNALSYNKTTGVTTGSITGIDATVSGPSCSADTDGTGAGLHNGQVSVRYTNSTGKLTVLTTGGNMHVYKVIGCAGLIANGDAVTYSGTYTVSPKQTITSP